MKVQCQRLFYQMSFQSFKHISRHLCQFARRDNVLPQSHVDSPHPCMNFTSHADLNTTHLRVGSLMNYLIFLKLHVQRCLLTRVEKRRGQKYKFHLPYFAFFLV